MQLCILYEKSNHLYTYLWKKLLAWEKYFNLNFTKFMHEKQAQYEYKNTCSIIILILSCFSCDKLYKIVKVSKKMTLKLPNILAFRKK